MRRSNEPFFWSLFSAGGVMAALLLPGLIVLTGFLLPAEQIDFDRLQDIVTNPIARPALFGLAFLAFFHSAHRIRHVMVGLGLKRLGVPIAVVAYAAALIGTVWAGSVAFG